MFLLDDQAVITYDENQQMTIRNGRQRLSTVGSPPPSAPLVFLVAGDRAAGETSPPETWSVQLARDPQGQWQVKQCARRFYDDRNQ